MARQYSKTRERRYEYLTTRGFTPLEARELSVLEKQTPALKLLIAEREQRRTRFEKIASRKIALRVWRRRDIPAKWTNNLSRMYTKRGWRVREGPVGNQPDMPRGSPNPWAMYRSAEKVAPPKRGVSPWQLRKVFGKTRLERGLIFIQQAEKRGGVSLDQVRQWISEKDTAIKRARGGRRKQLIVERDRLGRLLQ